MSRNRAQIRQHALRMLERQRHAPGDRLSDEEVMDIALAAQREARRQRNRPKARHGQSRK